MRVPYDQIFQVNADGSVSPRMPVSVGGITMGGPGISFNVGVSFGGVDIASLRGKDIEIERQADAVIIKGFYQY